MKKQIAALALALCFGAAVNAQTAPAAKPVPAPAKQEMAKPVPAPKAMAKADDKAVKPASHEVKHAAHKKHTVKKADAAKAKS